MPSARSTSYASHVYLDHMWFHSFVNSERNKYVGARLATSLTQSSIQLFSIGAQQRPHFLEPKNTHPSQLIGITNQLGHNLILLPLLPVLNHHTHGIEFAPVHSCALLVLCRKRTRQQLRTRHAQQQCVCVFALRFTDSMARFKTQD